MRILHQNNDLQVIETDHGRIYIQEKQRDSVVLLARQGHQFVLIRQYREPVAEYVIQLPGGGMEPGETLEQAARRELREETGYECGEVQYLGKLVAASWRSNEVTHVFYSEDVHRPSQQALEKHEKIEVLLLTVEECLRGITEQEITDSELCYAVLQMILQGYIAKV